MSLSAATAGAPLPCGILLDLLWRGRNSGDPVARDVYIHLIDACAAVFSFQVTTPAFCCCCCCCCFCCSLMSPIPQSPPIVAVAAAASVAADVAAVVCVASLGSIAGSLWRILHRPSLPWGPPWGPPLSLPSLALPPGRGVPRERRPYGDRRSYGGSLCRGSFV